MNCYTIHEQIQKMRKVWNDEHEHDIYTANNWIINTCKSCFDAIMEFNQYNPTNRVYFDLKTNWDLIRECKLDQVIDNIAKWLQSVDTRYNGKVWVDVKASEILVDETAELYASGCIVESVNGEPVF